jgi:hypothetical protein
MQLFKPDVLRQRYGFLTLLTWVRANSFQMKRAWRLRRDGSKAQGKRVVPGFRGACYGNALQHFGQANSLLPGGKATIMGNIGHEVRVFASIRHSVRQPRQDSTA